MSASAFAFVLIGVCTVTGWFMRVLEKAEGFKKR